MVRSVRMVVQINFNFVNKKLNRSNFDTTLFSYGAFTAYLDPSRTPKFILSCSKRTKVSTVWGPSLAKAGK